jgi:hypothetical protein
MIIVAFINNLGEIQNIMSPGADSDYEDGQTYGNLIAKHLPHDTDWGTAIETYVFKDGTWSTRDRRPGPFYLWTSSGWTKNTTDLLNSITATRNSMLFASDWTQLGDVPLSDSKKAEWASYRQSLRDFLTTLDLTSIDNPSEVNWPTQPA